MFKNLCKLPATHMRCLMRKTQGLPVYSFAPKPHTFLHLPSPLSGAQAVTGLACSLSGLTNTLDDSVIAVVHEKKGKHLLAWLL